MVGRTSTSWCVCFFYDYYLSEVWTETEPKGHVYPLGTFHIVLTCSTTITPSYHYCVLFIVPNPPNKLISANGITNFFNKRKRYDQAEFSLSRGDEIPCLVVGTTWSVCVCVASWLCVRQQQPSQKQQDESP